MHKVARVQLPDLQMIDARLDYSVPVFNCVVQLCKELGKCLFYFKYALKERFCIRNWIFVF